MTDYKIPEMGETMKSMKALRWAIGVALWAMLAGCASTPVEIPRGESTELIVRGDISERLDRKYAYRGEETGSSTMVQAETTMPQMSSTPIPSNGLSSQEIDRVKGEKRLALVIGNSAYQHAGRLKNPVNDADAMSRTLSRLGFDVSIHKDLHESDMKQAIDEFGSRLGNYDVGLFFFAGHGIQVDGINYLIPVNVDLKSENDVEYTCVEAGRVLGKMEDAGCRVNIVMLDACRNNPFERSWSRSVRGSGLAEMSNIPESLIAYATAPGNTASDGDGDNGLYTSAVLQHIETPNITIEEMFKRVRRAVLEKTGGEQRSWESTSITSDFYFKVAPLAGKSQET